MSKKAFLITFSSNNQPRIIEEINKLMSIFKESIKTDRKDTFFSELIKELIYLFY